MLELHSPSLNTAVLRSCESFLYVRIPSLVFGENSCFYRFIFYSLHSPPATLPKSSSFSKTHTCIYIHIYMCACVCVCIYIKSYQISVFLLVHRNTSFLPLLASACFQFLTFSFPWKTSIHPPHVSLYSMVDGKLLEVEDPF